MRTLPIAPIPNCPKTGCLVCAAPLHYHHLPRRVVCYFCAATCETSETCEKGHYICNRCHCLPANDLIERLCLAGNHTDPLALANGLMAASPLAMHGPEHHFLVPAVLLPRPAGSFFFLPPASWRPFPGCPGSTLPLQRPQPRMFEKELPLLPETLISFTKTLLTKLYTNLTEG